MKQARVLEKAELRRVLDHISTRPHAARNRCLVLMSFKCGLRAKEISSLRYQDVIGSDGTIKDEIYLAPEQTKGRHSRTIYVNTKMRKELADYVAAVPPKNMEWAFFGTQKNPKRGFTPNTLVQFFHTLYENCQISGASSHSGRRSFCTQLCNSGVSIQHIQRLAGHRDIQTTAQYLSSNPSQLKAAVELV